MTNRARSLWLVAMAGLVWALLLHDVYWLRVVNILHRESLAGVMRRIQHRIGQVPGLPLLAAVAVVLLVAAGILVLRRLRKGARGGSDWPAATPAVLAVLLLLPSPLLLARSWARLPIQWSLVVAFVVLCSMLVLVTVRSRRSLMVGQALVMGVALLVALGLQLGRGRRTELQWLHSAIDTAFLRLEERHRELADLDARAALDALAARFQSDEPVRLEDRLNDAVLEEAPAYDPNQGILVSVPDRNRLEVVGDSGHAEFVSSPEGLILAHYAGGTTLQTAGILGLDLSSVGSIRLRMKVSAGREFQLHWNEGESMNPLAGIRVPLAVDGEFHTYEITASVQGISHSNNVKRIDRIFLTPSDVDASVEIAWLRVLNPTAGVGEVAPMGRGYQNLNGEMRRVLSLRFPCRVRFTVQIPRVEPRLSLGLALAPGSDPASVRVDLQDATPSRKLPSERPPRETLLEQRVDGSDRWQDHLADLGRWRGRSVDLVFEVGSPGRGALFLSNPTVLGPRKPGPNILVYLVDCLRADHCGIGGRAGDITPNVDAFAREGVVFEQAFSNGCTTKLSVPSIMSSHPVTATGVRQSNGMSVLPDAFPTLPELLRRAGYATVAVTANGNLGPYSGTHQGFSWLIDQYIAGGEKRVHWSADPDMSGDILVDQALDWIGGHRDRRFFLYLHTLDAHGPYNPPSPYRHWYEQVSDGTPVPRHKLYDPDWVERPTREGRVALYDGTVQYSDQIFRRMLDGLDSLGVARNTLVIFTADHGEYFGEHGMWGHFPPPYVQGTHIPLVMRWPGSIPAGRRVDANVQLMDVMPTILDAAGFDVDTPLFQGESLLPLAMANASEEWVTRAVYVEGNFQPSVHIGRFHFLAERNLLWFLEDDPDEARLINGYLLTVGIKRRLRDLASLYQETYAPFHRKMASLTSTPLTVNPETLRQLRALGYID